jgi:hypothetical protein
MSNGRRLKSSQRLRATGHSGKFGLEGAWEVENRVAGLGSGVPMEVDHVNE